LTIKVILAGHVHVIAQPHLQERPNHPEFEARRLMVAWCIRRWMAQTLRTKHVWLRLPLGKQHLHDQAASA
jgi:hypothetical protein